ncbi:MAG: DUF1177 domain-containing protein [Firmicutes bacterium]|nr:DUF1177 domain-containing protein [Bacillota bacterium]MBQ2059626.1 DUF1177 domain-containing protein [Bacillota bacterium]
MLIKQIIELFDILDDPAASGQAVKDYLLGIKPDANVEIKVIEGPKGTTDMVKIRIPGSEGKASGGSAPTIGLLGRLGGIGARPEITGFVSDGDGALCALACAAKLLDMQVKGDVLKGDVFVSTQICPHAPTTPHKPVPFMNSPVEMADVNREEVTPELDAILTVDTTKGNRIINKRGFAISNTVMQGWILPVSEDLLQVMQVTTGQLPAVFPLSMQDITPYANKLYHMNSILQPATASAAPCVGIAITAETMVPGCASGASHPMDVEEAARYMIEVSKAFGSGELSFYDEENFAELVKRYGSMEKLQTVGEEG